ncbi:MAG TPA: aldose epimerase family protein [Flavobacterium sp.]|jgi:aldose 1-epimerase
MENNTEGQQPDFDGEFFGITPDGKKIGSYKLYNSNGMEVTVINYGATITSLKVPAKHGITDVVLGFDNIDAYIRSHDLPAPPYFGTVAGRYAGRIENGRFKIDDKEHVLNVNNNGHTLHGGPEGFDRKFWEVRKFVKKPEMSITLGYVSPDGEEGFPGEMDVNVTYTLTDDNEVLIDYDARCTKDTIINLTQHSYFNLEGHTKDLTEQELLINSSILLEIDDQNIPSGKIISAAEKQFDFSHGGKCPTGIDDSFVIADPSSPAATLTSKKNGLQLTVTSDQRCLHIYVGGSTFGVVKGKENVDYHMCSGICFESQNFPDAPNHANFPSAILRSGETYTQKTKWKFESIN